MRGKQLILACAFLVLTILFLEEIFAINCEIKTSCLSGEYSLMELSGPVENNPDGYEGSIQGALSNPAYYLCCEYSKQERVCNGENKLIGLSNPVNGLAEIPENENYPFHVCVEGFSCQSNAAPWCNIGSRVLKLEGETDSLIFDKNENGIPNVRTICCEYDIPQPKINCEDYNTRQDCWESEGSCTWIPPWKEDITSGGHCCRNGQEWKQGEGCVFITSSL